MNIDPNNPLFLLPMLIGPGVVLSGIINLFWPAKKINQYYGYRTKRARRSQARWDFAQKFHAREMIWMGILLSLLAIPGLYIQMENRILATFIGLSYAFILTSVLIYRTQNALLKKFGT